MSRYNQFDTGCAVFGKESRGESDPTNWQAQRLVRWCSSIPAFWRGASLQSGVHWLKRGNPFRASAYGGKWRRVLRHPLSSGLIRRLAFRSICGRPTLIINIFRNLVQKTLSLLEPPSQGFHEALIPLTALELRRCLRIRW